MPLLSLSRTFSVISPAPPRQPSSGAPKLRRRTPLFGALCLLSLGTLTAIGFRSGCAAQSLSRLHFLGSKAIAKPSTRGLHSTGMEAASTTVPSIVVYVTVPNKDAGIKLAESIIKEKLAACVNRVPGIQSVYWWDGKIQTDSEELLIIKTRESLLGALTGHVKSNHEYEVPEVIALPITGGNLKYLEWIKDSTRS
ncbi:protein CutA 1, chloroplastic-like isoform X1 [Zingiber officinale]|uniref:protein CutA 1, chloroplastic-like isoform X1 n=2 Tax=Zingiber officinale TaxID=94328 RepID=UPI001C4A8967|nr:protein CutA 1, chloroplastic-like isoform X1 [Zingiber officinale]